MKFSSIEIKRLDGGTRSNTTLDQKLTKHCLTDIQLKQAFTSLFESTNFDLCRCSMMSDLSSKHNQPIKGHYSQNDTLSTEFKETLLSNCFGIVFCTNMFVRIHIIVGTDKILANQQSWLGLGFFDLCSCEWKTVPRAFVCDKVKPIVFLAKKVQTYMYYHSIMILSEYNVPISLVATMRWPHTTILLWCSFSFQSLESTLAGLCLWWESLLNFSQFMLQFTNLSMKRGKRLEKHKTIMDWGQENQ